MYEMDPNFNANTVTWTDNLVCAAGKFGLYSSESWYPSKFS